ncbi:MAG: peptidylprolyl isomerase [Pirellulaceae bacterium]
MTLGKWIALTIAFLTGCSLASGFTGKNPMAPRGFMQQEEKQEESDNPLLNPEKANETAPDVFKAKFETTQGDFVMEVHREWSPNGADRFYNLVKIGYFTDIAIFRSIEGFMFQFGIHGDPAVNKAWDDANIKDDPSVKDISNTPGTITFAKTGLPNSRSVQFFINLNDNGRLDDMGFTPFGKVVEGADVFGKIFITDENPREVQGRFTAEGNDYIKQKYPDVDFINSVTLVEGEE